jgi:hypothetical protein
VIILRRLNMYSFECSSPEINYNLQWRMMEYFPTWEGDESLESLYPFSFGAEGHRSEVDILCLTYK